MNPHCANQITNWSKFYMLLLLLIVDSDSQCFTAAPKVLRRAYNDSYEWKSTQTAFGGKHIMVLFSIFLY